MSNEKILRFEIAMSPTELPGIGEWSNGLTLTKTITGDLIGSSEGLFINAGQAEGMRSYIVIEKLTGQTPDGEEAGVILEHGGVENDDSAWFGRIVPGTGIGAWEDMTGTIRFASDDDGEMMVLTVG